MARKCHIGVTAREKIPQNWRLKGNPPQIFFGMKRELIILVAIYALCLTLTSGFWHKPIALSLCYILISVFMLARWHGRSDLLFYCAAFVLGPIGEAVAVHFRAWEYAKPLYLIPVWLPFLWGIFGLFLKKVCETLTAR